VPLEPPDPPSPITRRRLLALGAAGLLGAAISTLPSGRTATAAVTRPARATRLRQGFSGPIGRWQAGDLPHAYALPDGRTLWLLNDSFLSDTPDGPIDDRSRFVRNAAIVEDGGDLSLVETHDASFLADGEQRYDRWWWFHGGEVDGDLLHVVTTEMIRVGELGWAINFEPRSTWITSIDWTSTPRVVRHEPAPEPGVAPVHGFCVASDDDWTYLYGNRHLYGDGTTDTTVARVRRGQLLDRPRFWNGVSWVDDPTAAAVIHRAGRSDCRLHVSRHDRRWYAVTKLDEFLGTDVVVYAADRPVGPFREQLRFSPPTRTGDDRTCTYDAMAAPIDTRRLLVWWSNNAFAERDVRERPERYRPSFAVVELPTDRA
jgi:hypothetical protein